MKPRRASHGSGRQAAIGVVLSAAIILGFTCFLLAATVWRQPAPPPDRFYTSMPGVDLSGLTDAELQTVLRRLNVERCPCGCMRTIARCRNTHGCSLSLMRARRVVADAIASRRPARGARN